MGKHGTKEFLVGISVIAKIDHKVGAGTRFVSVIRPVKDISWLGLKVGVLYIGDGEGVHNGVVSFKDSLACFLKPFAAGYHFT